MPARRPPDSAEPAQRLARLLPPTRRGWLPPGPHRDDPDPAGDGDLEDDPDAPGNDRFGALPGGDPGGGRRVRLDPGRRGAAVLAVVALLGALFAGLVVLRGRPQAVPAPVVVSAGVPVPGGAGTTGPAVSGAPPAAGRATPTAEPVVVVAVSGRVARPGLVRLPAGSRVDDALAAAGGAVPGTDLSGVNLARRLVDGELVAVGVPQVAEPAAGGAAPAGPLDLNLATAAQLEELPGVGPVLAQHVVEWRTRHGRFASVDQLREVSGIGESKYAQLKGRVRV